MRIVYFTHSLLSDWNHGNAHFLRGVASDLIERGHQVTIYEPRLGWSLANLVVHHGTEPVARFHRKYRSLDSVPYDADTIDLDEALDGADLVIVHEWNEPQLVARLGRHRRRHSDYRLLFHDTHHRSATAPQEMSHYDLGDYDGVLAFGEVVREIYLQRGWAHRVWTWHEAADVRLFQPMPSESRKGDLIWIGNWGDEERSEELRRFLIEPVKRLRLRACVHGVRYPPDALAQLANAGIAYAGWLANYEVPAAFARFRVTVHVPRRPYVEALPGIPTIRPFEALACGMPLVCSPWKDAEHLFTPGEDYLVAQTGEQMRDHLQMLLTDAAAAQQLADRGRQTILDRHTCAHRVDELLGICRELGITHTDVGNPPAGSPSRRNRLPSPAPAVNP